MSKLKPATAVALALGLAFTAAPSPVWAATSTQPQMPAKEEQPAGMLSQQEAIDKVSDYIEIPNGYAFSGITYYEGGKTNRIKGQWRISYQKQMPDNRNHHLQIVLDAETGTLTSYSNWGLMEEGGDTDNADRISRDEAKQLALDLLSKFAPDKTSDVKELLPPPSVDYDPSRTDTGHSFNFVRHVNGIPYLSNGVNFSFTPSGDLIQFDITWHEGVKFPNPESTLTAEEAAQQYEDALEVVLQYRRVHDRYAPQSSLQLIYTPARYSPYSKFPWIDAVTGKAVGFDGQPIDLSYPLEEMQPIAEQPVVLDKELKREEAVAYVAEMGISLDDYDLLQAAYHVDPHAGKIWELNYEKRDSETDRDIQHAMVRLNAETGDLMDMYHSSMGKAPEEEKPVPVVTEEQARQNAIDFMKKALPSHADKIALNKAQEKGPDRYSGHYEYAFNYLIDGIPVTGLSLHVVIDEQTGGVIHFQNDVRSMNTALDNYPKQADAISPETAEQAYVEQFPLLLLYVPTQAAPIMSDVPEEAALVYTPFSYGPSNELNAITGQWVSPWGKNVQEPVTLTDIEGHWAADALQKLVKKGVFSVEDGQVKPNAPVTRAELFRHILKAFELGQSGGHEEVFTDLPESHPYFIVVGEALRRNWISREQEGVAFRPDGELTRGELAGWLVDMLDYDDLSAAPEAFTARFADVPKGDKDRYADISIVAALGLMTGTGDRFSPDQTVTRAQAAVIIDRLLEKYEDKVKRRY